MNFFSNFNFINLKNFKKIIICFIFLIMAFCSFAIASDNFDSIDTVKKDYDVKVLNFFNRYYVDKNYISDVKVIYEENLGIENEESEPKISINLYLNESQFSDEDLEFIKSVIIGQIGLDLRKGNTINLYKIPFTAAMYPTAINQPAEINESKIDSITALKSEEILKSKSQPQEISNSVGFNFARLTNSTLNNQNFYTYLFLIFVVIFTVGFFVIIFLIFYLINMNKKMDLLILNNFANGNGNAQKNILLDNTEYEVKAKDKEINPKNFKDEDLQPNNQENIMTEDLNLDIENDENNEFADILSKIESLNNSNDKNENVIENLLNDEEKKVDSDKNKQFQDLEQIIKLPEKLLFVLLKNYEINLLAVAFLR